MSDIDKNKKVEKAIDGFTDLMSALGWNIDKKIDVDIEILEKELEDAFFERATSTVVVEREPLKRTIAKVKSYRLELETYKKIAEKLALGCKQLFKECPIYCEEVCEERKENKKTCVECLIDMARNEVKEECTSQKKNILNN